MNEQTIIVILLLILVILNLYDTLLFRNKDTENLRRIRYLLEFRAESAEVLEDRVDKSANLVSFGTQQKAIDMDLSDKMTQSDSIWEEDALEAEEREVV